MKGLSLNDVRDEIVSLLNESTDVLQNGNQQAAVSILVEAQFLLSDAIQNEMNVMVCAPSSVPSADGS